MTGLVPLKDRVIVQPEHQGEYETASGLYVADDGALPAIGTVVSVGAVDAVAVDDVVIFSPLAGSRLDHAGASLLVLKADDILAIWE